MNNDKKCFSSISLDSFPEQYCCDICGTEWTADQPRPICKGVSKEIPEKEEVKCGHGLEEICEECGYNLVVSSPTLVKKEWCYACGKAPCGGDTTGCPMYENTVYFPTPTHSDWKERFDKEFGKFTLGTLSGGANSPVFHNNALEVPRLINFIASEIALAEERERRRCIEIVREKTPPHVTREYRDTDNMRDKILFAISNPGKALSDVLISLQDNGA